MSKINTFTLNLNSLNKNVETPNGAVEVHGETVLKGSLSFNSMLNGDATNNAMITIDLNPLIKFVNNIANVDNASATTNISDNTVYIDVSAGGGD